MMVSARAARVCTVSVSCASSSSRSRLSTFTKTTATGVSVPMNESSVGCVRFMSIGETPVGTRTRSAPWEAVLTLLLLPGGVSTKMKEYSSLLARSISFSSSLSVGADFTMNPASSPTSFHQSRAERCLSESRTITFSPSEVSAKPSIMAVVVLPVPPLVWMIEMTLAIGPTVADITMDICAYDHSVVNEYHQEKGAHLVTYNHIHPT